MSIRREPSEVVDRLAREVVDSAIQVHRALGPGYLESFYEEALVIELTERGIPFARQVAFTVDYGRQPIGAARMDLLIGGGLIVELKAVDHLAPIHVAQALSYLKAMNLELALLLNFNVPRMKDGIRRVVRTSL